MATMTFISWIYHLPTYQLTKLDHVYFLHCNSRLEAASTLNNTPVSYSRCLIFPLWDFTSRCWTLLTFRQDCVDATQWHLSEPTSDPHWLCRFDSCLSFAIAFPSSASFLQYCSMQWVNRLNMTDTGSEEECQVGQKRSICKGLAEKEAIVMTWAEEA